MAKARAAEAEAAYLAHLQNAWRPSHQEHSGSIARDARLPVPNWNDLFGEK